MALNPEIVAEVLKTQFGQYWYGDWHENGMFDQLMREKVVQRATCPESFAQWLTQQHFFILKEHIPAYVFTEMLIVALAPADLAVLTEKTRLMTHKILFIESEQNIPLLTKLIKSYALSRFAIPASHIKITHRSYPPESKLLVQLIYGHTSAVLHNLSCADLVRIKLAVKNDTALVSRILIVKTNVLTNEQQNLYDELSAYGIMLIEKPYPSIVEIIRFALGIN